MNIKKLSLFLVGIIWLTVGLALGTIGIKWLLTLSFGPKVVIFISLSVIFGLLKGKYILKKVAIKYCKRSENIYFNNKDALIGWIKILGIKGGLLIGFMVLMGSVLRHSNIDRPILGIIYLSVGIALVYASKMFFNAKTIP